MVLSTTEQTPTILPPFVCNRWLQLPVGAELIGVSLRRRAAVVGVVGVGVMVVLLLLLVLGRRLGLKGGLVPVRWRRKVRGGERGRGVRTND